MVGLATVAFQCCPYARCALRTPAPSQVEGLLTAKGRIHLMLRDSLHHAVMFAQPSARKWSAERAVEMTENHFILDLPTPTRKTDSSDNVRKEAALALIHDPDCIISAKKGSIQSGGGAIVELHLEGHAIEGVAPADRVCGSMRSGLVAMLAGAPIPQPGPGRPCSRRTSPSASGSCWMRIPQRAGRPPIWQHHRKREGRPPRQPSC